MITVLVVFGGMTPEHDLSCKSAGYILDNIDRSRFETVACGITKDGKWYYTEATTDEIRDCVAWEKSSTNRTAMINTNYGAKELLVFGEDGKITAKHVDVVFARMAGNTGEDGKLQGLWEIAGIPYVGCDVMSSAVSMDKDISYMFADNAGIRRPLTYSLLKTEYAKIADLSADERLNAYVEKAGYPLFVKPASAGSSIGISKVRTMDELVAAVKKAFDYSVKVVIEEGIVGHEIKVGVLGNRDIEFGAICDMIVHGDWNDYETKYEANPSEKHIPAEFPKEIEDMILEKTRLIWDTMGCRGFSRIDWFLTPENELVFNEINTMPGFKPESVYPVLFKAAGVGYTELISRLIDLALSE